MCCSGADLYYAPLLAFKYQFASEDNIFAETVNKLAI